MEENDLAEQIRHDLLSFLTPNAAPLRILVVESLTYLSDLRRMFPRAELYAVTSEADAPEMASSAGTHWLILDYLAVPLPYTRGYFDYIISDLALETVDNPQDIASGFSTFLKETGSLLTSFRNVRHWSVLQNLMDGHFYNFVSRLYARAEFENLLYASFYKSVRMRHQQREAPDGLLDRLIRAGFENEQDDLETEFYLVCADRSMPELALLKSMYTQEERRQIVRMIHRVEYDIECAKSAGALWEIILRVGIFPAYLTSFVRETVIHTEVFYHHLSHTSYEHLHFIYEMLEMSIAESGDPMEREMYRRLQREIVSEKR